MNDTLVLAPHSLHPCYLNAEKNSFRGNNLRKYGIVCIFWFHLVICYLLIDHVMCYTRGYAA